MTTGTDTGIDSSTGAGSVSLSDALASEAQSASRVREQAIRTELANNPQALRALDRLSANLNCYALTDEQKVQALNDFMAAPNAATAAFVEGRIAQDLGVNAAAAHSLVSPDAGTLTIGGQTYTIDNGSLLGADGRRAGTITNDGVVQLNGEQATRNVYTDLGARVQLRETIDGEQATLLDLHAADRRGRLDDANVNTQFADRVKDTLVRARQEGMAMQMDLVYRTFAHQDQLYAQGRTEPGQRVTNARGGQSWHNYGLGADVVFSTANGQPSWPENGNWTRYGEIAESQGLTWGGRWRNPDRPHVEYHPGFGAGDAGGFVNTHNRGGLEGVWDRMGIGQQP